MIALQCAICGRNQKLKELYPKNFTLKKITPKTFSARRTPDRIHYRFVKCLNCSLIFSNPILPAQQINKLYKESEFEYNLESTFLKKTYGYYLKKLLPESQKNKLTLLDIGCGNGFFLEEVKAMGVDGVYGIEPGRLSVMKAAKWLQKRIKIGFLNSKSYKRNSFDIVCCFQTLDHIVNPNTFLQQIYTILKPGGKVLLVVHNTEGLSVKLFGEKSPIFDIEHIYLFNKINLRQIFKKNKFVDIEIFDVKNNYPLMYWFRMAPIPAGAKKIILKLLNKTGTANTSLTLKAGNIGLIATKPV